MNPEPSEIESEIQAQVADATHDSQGQFTIDRKHALRKLRGFLLPSPAFWVLKVVQAAVASGAKQVVILQTPSTTEIRFLPGQKWTVAGLEAALLAPEDESDRAVNHLKRGLWALTMQVDGFLLTVPGESPSTLRWDGEHLNRIERPSEESLVLTVQHANVDLRWCRKFLEVLQLRAYTCPIPLSVNGRRIDGLQRDNSHGNKPVSHAYQLSLVDLEGLPQFDIPPSSYEKAPPAGAICHLRFPLERPRQASAACLLSLKVGAPHGLLQSFLHWVLDGVILTSQPLYAHGHNCWCSLYASAAGLPLDLGGFQIIDTSRTAGLAYQIGLAFYTKLSQTKIDLKGYVASSRSGKRRWGLALGSMGACALFTGTAGMVIGLLACGAGALSTVGKDVASEQEKILQAAFGEMLERWPGSPCSASEVCAANAEVCSKANSSSGVHEASNRWG